MVCYSNDRKKYRRTFLKLFANILSYGMSFDCPDTHNEISKKYINFIYKNKLLAILVLRIFKF